MCDSGSFDEQLVKDYVREIAALAPRTDEQLVVAVEILRVVQKALRDFATVSGGRSEMANLRFMADQLKALANQDQPREIKGGMLYAETLVREALQKKLEEGGRGER
jgi:erythromycin esterase-like protein